MPVGRLQASVQATWGWSGRRLVVDDAVPRVRPSRLPDIVVENLLDFRSPVDAPWMGKTLHAMCERDQRAFLTNVSNSTALRVFQVVHDHALLVAPR